MFLAGIALYATDSRWDEQFGGAMHRGGRCAILLS